MQTHEHPNTASGSGSSTRRLYAGDFDQLLWERIEPMLAEGSSKEFGDDRRRRISEHRPKVMALVKALQ